MYILNLRVQGLFFVWLFTICPYSPQGEVQTTRQVTADRRHVEAPAFGQGLADDCKQWQCRAILQRTNEQSARTWRQGSRGYSDLGWPSRLQSKDQASAEEQVQWQDADHVPSAHIRACACSHTEYTARSVGQMCAQGARGGERSDVIDHWNWWKTKYFLGWTWHAEFCANCHPRILGLSRLICLKRA